jgi:D-3-phosphoglycerate dehydrogenase
MASNAKRLVYFEQFIHPVAETVYATRPDIVLERLAYASPEAANWEAFARAHGYQVGARTELVEPWFVDQRLLERSPQLLAVASLGAGYDVIDVEACTKAGVVVVNQSGANAEAVAEHALGMMLALSKRIAMSDRDMRRTQNLDRWLYTGNDILGKTVGIIGLGNIGRRTAELCKGLFRMRVLAYDPYVSKEEMVRRHAEKVELDQLLAEADFISMHTPRTAETFGMMGRPQFQRMKRTAYFVNTSRGGTHKEDELAAALAAGEIAGAGLDVFLEEPPPTDHPLLAFPNVIVTPHNAGVTYEARENTGRVSAEQWLDIFAGRVPLRLVNPAVWPRYRERFAAILGFAPENPA